MRLRGAATRGEATYLRVQRPGTHHGHLATLPLLGHQFNCRPEKQRPQKHYFWGAHETPAPFTQVGGQRLTIAGKLCDFCNVDQFEPPASSKRVIAS